MSVSAPQTNRQLVPRWRSFSASVESLGSIHAPENWVVAEGLFQEKMDDWRKHQTVVYAADVVGAAVALGREDEAQQAAQFILARQYNASAWTVELAQRVLGERVGALSEESVDQSIRFHRQVLAIEPRSAVNWVELARCYACLGASQRAERSMTVALGLVPDNRFVLRSAARLWIHLRDERRAHRTLVRSERTKHDPWLMAAEISAAALAGESPKWFKRGKRIVEAGQVGWFHLSELASASATVEMNAGRRKAAERLFVRSLQSPTDNSIAQIAWVPRTGEFAVIDPLQFGVPRVDEAQYWTSYWARDWKHCLSHCQRWFQDEPFAERPAELGSHVAAVALRDYRECERLAEEGLKANPGRFGLLNNVAFARAMRGNLEAAEQAIRKAARSASGAVDEVVLRATRGLLDFRRGEVERGREWYSEAIEKAEDAAEGDKALVFLAESYYALEEARIRSARANAACRGALDRFKLLEKYDSRMATLGMMKERVAEALERGSRGSSS